MRQLYRLMFATWLFAVCMHIHAQSLDYENSSLLGVSQCDPVSCMEGTDGFPETTNSFLVNEYGTCYPAPQSSGQSFPLTTRAAVAFLNCQEPGVYAIAEVEYSTTEIPEGCDEYYVVDYETAIAEIFYSTGTIAFRLEASYGCDGSYSGPIQYGTAPC